MVAEYVMTGGRGSGKTYASMTEIHELILAGERPTILIVLQELDDLNWWYEMWNQRFPHIPMPTYTTLRNTLGVSGRRWKHVYIEYATDMDDGWRNGKLWGTVLCNLSADAEIVYIYNHNYDSGSAHTWSQYPPDEPLAPLKVRSGFLRRYVKRSKPV